MPYIDIVFAITYQSVSLFLIIFAQNYFYKGRKSTYNKSESRILISMPISTVIFFMYYLEISQLMTIYIIVLTLSLIFVGIKFTFLVYIFILLSNLLFSSNHTLLVFYLVMIINTYLFLLWVKNYYYRFFTVFLLSFLYLNIELYLTNAKGAYYVIYNLACFIVWSSTVHVTLYYYKKYFKLQELQKDKFLDSVTHTNNYSCLLKHSYKLLKNNKVNISLTLINVDRLKDINTLYGSYYGDEAIKIVANSIKENILGYGEVYRLAGDTFCVVAINEKFKMMQTISERIRLDVTDRDLIIDNNKINLSVSVGGYYGKIDSKNIDDYIELAQDSLLNSKYKGRNRVILNYHMVYYPEVM